MLNDVDPLFANHPHLGRGVDGLPGQRVEVGVGVWERGVVAASGGGVLPRERNHVLGGGSAGGVLERGAQTAVRVWSHVRNHRE